MQDRVVSMNRILKIRSLIAQSFNKGGVAFLRPLFGDESLLQNCRNFEGLQEGDIVHITGRYGSSEFSHQVHKKNTVINRYITEFEKSGINPIFPVEVIDEVDRIISDPGIGEPGLTDFTSHPFVTIDNDGSKDLDQAVYVESSHEGFIIYYAIADASHYVKPGTALFSESIRRGASYYLPGYSVPMLPRELSEGIVSLNEGVERRALVFIIEIDASGAIVSKKMIRGRIRSRAKLSYSGVQKFYDHNEQSPIFGTEYAESVMLLQRAGRALAENGEKRGVINFERFENLICINTDGTGFNFTESGRNDAARWNEQVSLICNMAGAQLLLPETHEDSMHIQPVFRVHEPPDESSLHRLHRVIHSIVEIHSLDSCWIWRMGEESPGEYLSRLPRTGSEKRITETIERQILVTNQRSCFTSKPGGHFALKVDLYGRFSSPMREVVGIYSHKELLEKLRIEKPGSDEEDILIREQVINSANRSKEIQKSIDRFVNSLLLESVFASELDLKYDKRPVHCGTLLGMKESRMYVQLDSPRIEIKVYTIDVETETGGKLCLRDNILELRGSGSGVREFRAGDAVSLRLLSYDERDKWHFIPVDL